MGLAHRIPAPPLSNFVALFWSFDGDAPPHTRERLLPTATMDLVVRLDGGRAAAGVSGARSAFFEIDATQLTSVVGVHFKPGGGFPFFEPPAGALRDLRVPLDALWGCFAETLSQRLLEAQTPEMRFHILERALLDQSRGRLAGHPGVRWAIAQLGAIPCRSVTDVVEDIGIGAKRFTEIFCDEVGVTPKLYSRIRRFQHALAVVERDSDVDWTDVALACGYFDQAHFNHDFRRFCGISPSTYLRHRTSRNHVAVRD